LEPSLIADLINVETDGVVAEVIIDIKGNHKKVTEHAVRKLAEQIDHAIANRKN
jgi:hypothetical protein